MSVRNPWAPRSRCWKPQVWSRDRRTQKTGGQTILSLTPACRELFRTGRAARHDWLFRAIQTKLSPQQQQELAAAMSLLNRLVDT